MPTYYVMFDVPAGIGGIRNEHNLLFTAESHKDSPVKAVEEIRKQFDIYTAENVRVLWVRNPEGTCIPEVIGRIRVYDDESVEVPEHYAHWDGPTDGLLFPINPLS